MAVEQNDGRQALWEYRLFGLPLRSEIPLPELEPADLGACDAVEIRRAAVAFVPNVDPLHPLTGTADDATLSVPNVGRFRIRAGREILVDADPEASDRNVRLFLLGSAMGALLHRREILPLHANAIEIDGYAVAFLGHSGAGKSTLAAAFHDGGRRILSDDVCALTRAGSAFIAQPGIPRLRLWRDAVERSGRTVQGYERAFDALDKYTIGTDNGARAAATPLGAIYLLARKDEQSGVDIRRLSGVAAVQALSANTYRGAFVPIVGNPRHHFETCLALSRQVPVFELTRAWDVARFSEGVQSVEAHFRSLSQQAPASGGGLRHETVSGQIVE